MAAPSTGFEVANNLAGATPPLLLGEQTIDDGEALTVELLNVSELIELENTGDVDIKVGVHASGVAGTCYRLLKAGKAVALKWSTKLLVIINDSGSDGATVTGSITLTSRAAADFPDLTDANGFDGVQSHDGTRVAVA